MSRAVTAPQVYRAINAIAATLAKDGIPKNQQNLQDQYSYRSIDDVLNRLAPLLAKHRLCALPRVLRHKSVEHLGAGQAVTSKVYVLVAYDLVSSRDGSRHTVKASGEALDASDKATAKAISAAYKSAMLQTFCIPVGSEDADAKSQRLPVRVAEVEPPQGWDAWAEDIVGMIEGCETQDALNLMRSRHAALLVAVSRERAALYGKIGSTFTKRTSELAIKPIRKKNDLAEAARLTTGAEVDA